MAPGAEVVNEVELALAVRAGCPPERIVMNGVGKTDSDLRAALAAGGSCSTRSRSTSSKRSSRWAPSESVCG